MMTLIKKMVVKKRSAGEDLGEFFDIIFREMEREGETVSLDNAIQYIYTFFLVNLETTPRFLAAAVKLISDHPEVMQELQVHQSFSLHPLIYIELLLHLYQFPNRVMYELTISTQREHEAFVQNKTDKEAGLSWEDYKSMTFTQMV